MHSIRRSCQAAVKNSNNVCLYANGSRRAFSRTSARSRGTLPVFLESSSPELSTLLSTLNSKVLLPSHLTKEQQNLVYRKDNHAKLEAEPVEITLGEVTLPLVPIDRNHLPNRWATFRRIVEDCKTPADWENLVRAVEGFENAGIAVPAARKALVVRKLNEAGMQHLVLKALQRPKATGLRMSEPAVLGGVLRGVHDMGAAADWGKDETAKALRFSKQVVELLEDSEHHAAQDFRGRPAVVALPAELAAVMAERHGGDVEAVKIYAGRLVAALKQADYDELLTATSQKGALTSADFHNTPRQLDHVVALANDLLEHVVVWNALKTARKVLGADMPMAKEAQQYESKAAVVLTEGAANADRLRTKDGKKMVNRMVEAVGEAVARCS